MNFFLCKYQVSCKITIVAPVRESCILLNLLIYELNAMSIGIQHPGRGGSKIAEHKMSLLRLQNILNLNIRI
jgi:hypothetical protein